MASGLVGVVFAVVLTKASDLAASSSGLIAYKAGRANKVTMDVASSSLGINFIVFLLYQSSVALHVTSVREKLGEGLNQKCTEFI